VTRERRQSESERAIPAGTDFAPHLGPVTEDESPDRDRIDALELAIVLSHFDLGVIRKIREYRRGSRRSPKLLITTDRDSFLLKRRAPGRDDPARVAFSQEIQLRLAAHDFPVPGLLLTRSHRQPMLQMNRRVYEVFHFIDATRPNATTAEAEEAGRVLGKLHRLLIPFRPGVALTTGSYHAAPSIKPALSRIPGLVAAADRTAETARINDRCAFLAEAYLDASRRIDAMGLATLPPHVIHGDWHPGNLLFREGRVVAVLDFDSARMEPHILDVANAALQFSMAMTSPNDPAKWPEQLDVKRIRALVDGYNQSAIAPISTLELEALPWLIIEALVLEAALPIAATGRFGPLSGGSFLEMVERKVRWVRPRAGRLAKFLS